MISTLFTGMEIVGPSKRAWAGILIEFFWCLGEFLLLPFAHFFRNWRHLEIALSVPSIFLLTYWWSVHFLLLLLSKYVSLLLLLLLEDVPLVEVYLLAFLVFTRMIGEIYRRRFRSLLL